MHKFTPPQKPESSPAMPYHQTKKCMPWLLDFGFRVRHGRRGQCTPKTRLSWFSTLWSGCILGAFSKQANFGVCQFRKSFSPLVFFGVHCTLLKVHSWCIVSPWPQNAGRLQVPFLKNNTAQSALFCGGRHPRPKRPPTLPRCTPPRPGGPRPPKRTGIRRRSSSPRWHSCAAGRRCVLRILRSTLVPTLVPAIIFGIHSSLYGSGIWLRTDLAFGSVHIWHLA